MRGWLFGTGGMGPLWQPRSKHSRARATYPGSQVKRQKKLARKRRRIAQRRQHACKR